jgi:predicted protein tyrosine phosphatase
MTAVVPDDFVRLKYRQPLHELKFDDKTENKALSLPKKVKPKIEDLSEEMKAMRFRPAIMLPAHTQNTRVEQIIYSDDQQYRRDHKPTLFERVEVTRQIMKKTLRDEKRRAEIMRKKMEERERLAREAAEMEDDDDPHSEARSEAEIRSVADSEDQNQQNQERGDFHELSEVEMMQMDEEEIMEYKKAQLEEKERRILRERDAVKYHYEVKKWDRRKLAFYAMIGASGRSKGVVNILPWIELGGATEAENQMHMMLRNVTHVLNCTEEFENKFPQQFVYLRVPLRDSEHDDIDIHFESVLSFFTRVEQKRGKIIVHCDMGAARAPAFIIAFLVARKGIALADAYDFVCSMRPVTSINYHFLNQLAKLELSLGDGCSVLYHRDWQFFEFNNMKADIDPKTDWRKPEGVLATASRLHTKENDHDDHF